MVVTITSPTPGSTVANTITVKASVSPGGALIVGVQFQLDSANLGAEDTAAPYEVPWNTLNTSNGAHTLLAIARDALGIRYTSNPVGVTVSNGVPIATRFEETALSVAYTVGWVHRVGDRPFSGGTAAWSSKANATATLTFTGTSGTVNVTSFTRPLAGWA